MTTKPALIKSIINSLGGGSLTHFKPTAPRGIARKTRAKAVKPHTALHFKKLTEAEQIARAIGKTMDEKGLKKVVDVAESQLKTNANVAKAKTKRANTNWKKFATEAKLATDDMFERERLQRADAYRKSHGILGPIGHRGTPAERRAHRTPRPAGPDLPTVSGLLDEFYETPSNASIDVIGAHKLAAQRERRREQAARRAKSELEEVREEGERLGRQLLDTAKKGKIPYEEILRMSEITPRRNQPIENPRREGRTPPPRTPPRMPHRDRRDIEFDSPVPYITPPPARQPSRIPQPRTAKKPSSLASRGQGLSGSGFTVIAPKPSKKYR